MVKFIKSNLFFFLLLTTIVFLLYGKSINFDFTYGDDTNLILQKAEYLSDIKNLPTLFTTSCYYSKDFSYYRPILNLSFMLETAIFGVNTKIYHLTNIILFIFALYLMYVFLIKIKLNKNILKFLILLIAVHPVFTSTVVWIPARNDTLLAAFMYTSFIFFIDYLETKSTKDMLLYILFLMLSLLTKESAILTLFLFVSFVWCFGYKTTKKEVLTNILIFIPIILSYIYLRSIAVSGDNISYYLTQTAVIAKNTLVGSIIYLYQFVIPDVHVMLYNVDLNVFHFVVVTLILFLCCFGLYKNFISKKVFLWCVSVFILFIFPISFLTDEYIILNHRLVAVIPAIVIVVVCFIEKIMVLKNMKIFLFVFFIVLFSLYVSKSFSFENNYREKNIYWNNSYRDAPDCHATVYWMGRLSFEQGKFGTAKDLFIKANNLKPIYLCDLALIYYREGDMDRAEDLYNKSIQYGINKAQCYRNLSVIYLKRDNDINKAVEYAKLAVQQEPYDDGYKKYLRKLIDEKNNI